MVALDEVLRILHLRADHHVDHDVCGSLGNGTSVTDKSAVRDIAVLHFELYGYLITARRVYSLHFDVGIFNRVLVERMHVVIGYNFVVKSLKVHIRAVLLPWTAPQGICPLPLQYYRKQSLRGMWT